jgi:hypothetical protein
MLLPPHLYCLNTFALPLKLCRCGRMNTLTWHIIGASVQGTSHQKNDLPCQDAHGYRVLPSGVAIIAVADGAGSADQSAEGAQCAVEQVIFSLDTVLAKRLPCTEGGWQSLLTEAFHQARQAIAQLAETENVSWRAFATTLTCAVASDKWLVVGQIGDGIVVARCEDGGLFAATQPQHGEYANETFFLTMNEALQRVEVRVYPQPVQALAVMTDGLIRLSMDVAGNEPHPPFFRPLLAFAAQIEDEAEAQEQLAAFLASDRVCARTDDDKTLVLAVQSDSAAGSEPTVR